MLKDAVESPNGRYRYRLVRDWSGVADARKPNRPPVCWIMLNPSTADAVKDDPTVRRIIQFSMGWGYERLVVVNLFPLRSADPKALWTTAYSGEAVVVNNWKHIDRAMAESPLIVAAWGSPNPPGRNVIVNELCMMAHQRRAKLWCLGETADGSPRHPSPLGRVPLDTQPQVWRSDE